MSAHRRRSGKSLLGYKARGGSQYGDNLGLSAPTPRDRTNFKKNRDWRKKGPTGPQQQLLAQLCREKGEKYVAPKTSFDAHKQIERLMGRPVAD